ncbi:DSC E3 ubiquitin ligase complex subunit 2 [Leucoagaricus sp. SymC.cos]|nr:DSC E3 ubiquitin ligase complex subunit 2 [Leucoagaricus sp. SymC.cos]
MSFEHAPVTKAVMMSSALSSFLIGLFDVKHFFHLQLVPHVSRHHQYWRLATQYFAHQNSSDLFLAEILLYNLGIHIERRFGSVKYASFLVVTILLATLLEFLALLLLNPLGLNFISTGASVFIYSILYQYSRLVPSVYQFRIFGVRFSNKSFNYFLAFQLTISRPPGSFVVAIIGIITGQLYRSEIANFYAYRLPPPVISFSRHFLLPLIGSLRPPRRSTRAFPEDSRSVNTQLVGLAPLGNDEVVTTSGRTTQASTPRPRNTDNGNVGVGDSTTTSRSSVMREWVDELTGRTDRANAGIRVPTEAEISQLTSMFPTVDREVVVGALQTSRNIEGAVETLLSARS